MADFKTALEGLHKGRISVEKLVDQLRPFLDKNPQLANKFKTVLREFYLADKLSAGQFESLLALVADFTQRIQAPTTGAADDATQVVAPTTMKPTGGHDEATVVVQTEMTPHDAATAVTPTVSTPDTGGDTDFFDITGASAPDTSASVPTPTGTGWASPAAATTEDEGPVTVGTRIRDRFEITKMLGKGGMGNVWMATDLLKLEAQDRNPHLAIKVLNEDFKTHPEAFIALQREAARASKLAHPNIATVYDFDRTRGGTIYLTMELLDGIPLDKFIKKKMPPGGLPFDEAFEIIKGLGQGLAYAHKGGFAHSDFKPGNAFLTSKGPKILDFGIARAVKLEGQLEGDETKFDLVSLKILLQFGQVVGEDIGLRNQGNHIVAKCDGIIPLAFLPQGCARIG